MRHETRMKQLEEVIRRREDLEANRTNPVYLALCNLTESTPDNELDAVKGLFEALDSVNFFTREI